MKTLATLGYLAICALVIYKNQKRVIDSFRPLSSPIDWCEANYEVTPYVAEFWNSLTSFTMSIVAYVAPRHLDKKIIEHEPELNGLWILLALVGFGSVYFHGSLSVAGQVLDELPISLLAYRTYMIILPVKVWNPFIRRVLFSRRVFFLATIGLLILSLLFPILSHACVLLVPAMSLFTVLTVSRNIATPKGKTTAKPFIQAGVTFLALGATAWLTDRFGCPYLKPFLGFSPQLHAVWHIFISLACWSGIFAGVVMRLDGDGLPTHAIRTESTIVPKLVITK